MSRTIFRCKACRHSVLDAFASFHGVSIPLRPQCVPKASLPSQTPIPQQKRHYIPSTPLQVPAIENPESPTEVAYNSTLPPSNSAPPTQVPNSIPWYLRIPEPTPPIPMSPILALQEIPPLPSNPPSILQPMLDRLSTEIGLDNLSILDLRTLHPPPALGANLIMIVGTARSVKHLNVSADRFCRWLRTEWGLRPYADGLLGRNELKLKLRRKARREKMMGLVGAREMVNADYGITTGWVCVNVGMVDEGLKPRPKSDDTDTLQVLDPDRDLFDIEAGEYQNPTIDDSEAEQAPEQHDSNDTNDDGYVGFGSRVTSPRIVVQMFTEEKRLEMDLEGLWEHRNTKREKTAGRRQDEVEERVAGTKKDKISTKGLHLTHADGEDLNDVNEAWMHSASPPGSRRRSSDGGTWASKQNEAGWGRRRQEDYRRKPEPPSHQANQVTGQRATRDEDISLFG